MAIIFNASRKNYFFQISAGNAPQMAGTSGVPAEKNIVVGGGRTSRSFLCSIFYSSLITAIAIAAISTNLSFTQHCSFQRYSPHAAATSLKNRNEL
jgi:hypothetical protein